MAAIAQGRGTGPEGTRFPNPEMSLTALLVLTSVGLCVFKDPATFSGVVPAAGDSLDALRDHGDLFTYYRFMTLTTVGNGDISPVRQDARGVRSAPRPALSGDHSGTPGLASCHASVQMSRRGESEARRVE
jgi:hypothetical protein